MDGFATRRGGDVPGLGHPLIGQIEGLDVYVGQAGLFEFVDEPLGAVSASAWVPMMRPQNWG